MDIKDLDSKLRIQKEDGTEEEFNILFTYHNDNRNKDYVLLYKEENPDDVLLFEYNEDSTLDIVDDEEILSEAQEVLDRYDEDINVEDN